MSSGTALFIVKLLGLVLTGVFGVLGLVTDFKDVQTKKITKWGKIALFGIFISTAVSFVSQSIESLKSARDARESAKQAQDQIARSNQILNEINRSVNPLSNVRVTYWLTLPLDATELVAYRKRLLKGVEAIARRNSESLSKAGFVSQREASGAPIAVEITPASPLMPQRDEVIPFYLLRHSGLQFSFFKNHHAESELVASNRPAPDLWFQVSASENEHYSLEYNRQSRQLTIFAMNLPSDPKYWQSNNSIQAVPDLSNTQLAVLIDDTFVPTLPIRGERDAVGRRLSQLRSQMKLDSLVLEVNTRQLWLKRPTTRDMTHLVSSGVEPFALYATVFPSKVDDLQLH